MSNIVIIKNINDKKREASAMEEEKGIEFSNMSAEEKSNKYAAAQLEENKHEDDLREKPSLKVKHDGNSEYLEAEDDDLDILADAVHASMVSYYKRKNGYCQCCKYIAFMIIFILVCFLESHVQEGAYTHGVAHNFKETLFPDMMGDNLGFPGGRVPARYTGWGSVYDFFETSVAAHFTDPRVGDTLCTSPVEYPMWGGFGSTDCGMSSQNTSTLIVTASLTPELLPGIQQDIVCPPETRRFRLMKGSQFNYEKKQFTVYVNKEVGDTTTVGDASTWAPIVGSKVTIDDDIHWSEMTIINEKIPKLMSSGVYYVAQVRHRLDLTPEACKATATTASAKRRRMTTIEHEIKNEDLPFFENVMDSSSRKLAGSTAGSCKPVNTYCYKSADCCSNNCINGMCRYADEGNSATGSTNSACMPENNFCNFNQDCCSNICDPGTKLCRSASTNDGTTTTSSSTSGQSKAKTDLTTCYYAYDISIVPAAIYKSKALKAEWRQLENALEVGCNETFWNATNEDAARAKCNTITSGSTPTLSTVCGVGGSYTGALITAAATTKCAGSTCGAVDRETCCAISSGTNEAAIGCTTGSDCISNICSAPTGGGGTKCNCLRPDKSYFLDPNVVTTTTCNHNNDCCSKNCVNGECQRASAQSPASDKKCISDIDCDSGECTAGLCVCTADGLSPNGTPPNGNAWENCCSKNQGNSGGAICSACVANGANVNGHSDPQKSCCSRKSINNVCVASRRLFSNKATGEYPFGRKLAGNACYADFMPCAESTSCCSNYCFDGVCSPPTASGATSNCPDGSPNKEFANARKNGKTCSTNNACCSNYCDQVFGKCQDLPVDGGCQRLSLGGYCYENHECCSEVCTNNVCAAQIAPENVVSDAYVKACNNTLVGIFPKTFGSISGVKGLSSSGKCSIDSERPLLATAKYNLCARDPYTNNADTTRCIFNDGRGVTKDVSIGGTVTSPKTITQKAVIDAVDGEWMLSVTGIKNAKLRFNVTWIHPKKGLNKKKTQITDICPISKRSLFYSLGRGDTFDTGCKALQSAFSSRAATVCADMMCKDTTSPHYIFNYNKNNTQNTYFPNYDDPRERFFRGTGNKMIAGVLISQKRFVGRRCRPRDTKRFDTFFNSESTAICIDDDKLDEQNLAPFGADPVFLPSSSMFVEAEVKNKKKIFKKGNEINQWGKVLGKASPEQAASYSDLNKGGNPYGFKVSNDIKLAKEFGHAILFQNNLQASDALKLTNFLKEGFYLDALTRSVKVTYLTFNAYDKSYHKFNAVFQLSFPTGGIEVKYDHHSFSVDPYFENSILWPLQAVYWFLVFLTAAEEIKEMFIACTHGNNYFANGWNYAEVACVLFQTFNFVYWWTIQSRRDNFLPKDQYVVYPLQKYKVGGLLHDRNETEFNAALKMYAEAEYMTTALGNYETIQVTVLFILLLRWFKQLDFHPEFGVITRTCAQSWKSLSQWLVVFLVVQIVFILGGYYSFGQTVAEFSTLTDTIFVQYQLLNGDLSILASLWQTNNLSVSPIAAYTYVFTYYVIVFIVMLNVLLGIVIDAYTDQRDRAAEDPLTPDETPWEEMSLLFWHESKASMRACWECLQPKRKVNLAPMVEIQTKDIASLSDDEATALNNRARLAAQLREILSGALSIGGGSKLLDPQGQKIRLKTPEWGSAYYQLKYDKPCEMAYHKSNLLRTSRGDLTHEELSELLHYQFKRYSVDADKDKSLSKKVAELVIWRYGKKLTVETRRDIGIEYRNEMSEHRFNRLEEQIAFIAESGQAQWGEVQKAIVTVAATKYIPSKENENATVVSATQLISSQSVDTDDL
jgi:hypothetical protein